jgi:hypothetical protein
MRLDCYDKHLVFLILNPSGKLRTHCFSRTQSMSTSSLPISLMDIGTTRQTMCPTCHGYHPLPSRTCNITLFLLLFSSLFKLGANDTPFNAQSTTSITSHISTITGDIHLFINRSHMSGRYEKKKSLFARPDAVVDSSPSSAAFMYRIKDHCCKRTGQHLHPWLYPAYAISYRARSRVNSYSSVIPSSESSPMMMLRHRE